MLWRALSAHYSLIRTLQSHQSFHCWHWQYMYMEIEKASDKDKWAATWQNQQNECAPSEDSDQSEHPPSLIRVLAVHMKKAWVLSYPLIAQRRLRLIWVSLGTQSLCWFCHVAAQIFLALLRGCACVFKGSQIMESYGPFSCKLAQIYFKDLT